MGTPRPPREECGKMAWEGGRYERYDEENGQRGTRGFMGPRAECLAEDVGTRAECEGVDSYEA